MTRQDIEELKADIAGMIMARVEDIFIDMQNALDIKTGDVPPLDVIELEEREKFLAEGIAYILAYQKEIG